MTDTRRDYSLVDGKMVEQDIPLTPEEQAALAAQKAALIPPTLAAHRYEVETGGITVWNLPFATDRATQATLTGARILAKENPSFTVKWKMANDDFTTLTASQLIQLADAVAIHVQKCFTVEALVRASSPATIEAAIAAFDEGMTP